MLFGNSEKKKYFETSYIARNNGDDQRIVPKFYKEAKWFSLMQKVSGEDSDESRLKLHDWISLPLSNTQNKYYLKIRKWVHDYFKNIMNILRNEDRDDYHWRVEVAKIS